LGRKLVVESDGEQIYSGLDDEMAAYGWTWMHGFTVVCVAGRVRWESLYFDILKSIIVYLRGKDLVNGFSVLD